MVQMFDFLYYKKSCPEWFCQLRQKLLQISTSRWMIRSFWDLLLTPFYFHISACVASQCAVLYFGIFLWIKFHLHKKHIHKIQGNTVWIQYVGINFFHSRWIRSIFFSRFQIKESVTDMENFYAIDKTPPSRYF